MFLQNTINNSIYFESLTLFLTSSNCCFFISSTFSGETPTTVTEDCKDVTEPWFSNKPIKRQECCYVVFLN